MSMNVRLHPCLERHPEHCFYAETVFEIDKWANNVLSNIIPQAKSIELPVAISWTAGNHELRAVPGKRAESALGRANGDFDSDCTWLVEAWVLKCLKFHEDDWPTDRIIKSKAISAYLNELPDDWPVIVYYV